MKVYLHPEYKESFPELFNWQMLDSIKLSELACELKSQIVAELSQPPGNRVNVAGLRFALSRIAGKADI